MENNLRVKEPSADILPSVNLTDLFGSSNYSSFPLCNMCWAVGDVILVVVIILGNVLTILAVRLSRRLRSVTSNHLILSLAISDLFVGFAILYHLFFYITATLNANKIFCLLRLVFFFGACSASFYNVTAIAVDRYIAIVYPLEYIKYVTKRIVFIIIAVNWITAVCISTMPVYWNNYDPQNRCELSIVVPRYYIVGIFLPIFLTVWLSIGLLYLRIWKEARKHALRSKANGGSNTDYSHRKSNQVVLLILGCFSLCWLPYIVAAIFQVSLPHKPNSTVYHLMFWIAMCNSGVNPLIYAWKNKNFRKAFNRLLRFKAPDHNDYNSSFKKYLRKQSELTRRELELQALNEFRPVIVLKTISSEIDKEVPRQGTVL